MRTDEKKTLLELVRYLFSGITTTLVNIVLYHVILLIKIDYRRANMIALIGSKTYGYLINKKFVFRSHCQSKKELLKEIGSYVITRGFTGIADYLGLIIMVERLGADKIFSKYIIQVLVIVLNYIFGKFIVFRVKIRGLDK